MKRRGREGLVCRKRSIGRGYGAWESKIDDK